MSLTGRLVLLRFPSNGCEIMTGNLRAADNGGGTFPRRTKKALSAHPRIPQGLPSAAVRDLALTHELAMDVMIGPNSRLLSQNPCRLPAHARCHRCTGPAYGRRPHRPPQRHVHLRIDRDAGEIERTVRFAVLCERAILCRGDKSRISRRPFGACTTRMLRSCTSRGPGHTRARGCQAALDDQTTRSLSARSQRFSMSHGTIALMLSA
jgi:hypothetical protein